MTAISPLNSTHSIQSLLDQNTTTKAPIAKVGTPTKVSPSTLVTLGASAPAGNVYTIPGASGNSAAVATEVVESPAVNAVSRLMSANFSILSGARQFSRLGSMVLNDIGSLGNHFSQSVMLAGANASSSAIADAQSRLHGSAANEITLDLTMKSGAQVEISLGSDTNGLAVQVNVTNGTLSAADQTALGNLSKGFQDAIDGLTAQQPLLNLSGLMQFDSSEISSIHFNASVQGATGTQTVDFQADNRERSLNANGPDGTIRLSVDMSNPAIIGSAQQQAAAIKSYLQQFDNEQSRGHGNASLMSMFESAFTELNSNYTVGPTSAAFNALSALPAAGESMLTGLADFSASVTQAPVSSNPMKLAETDTFAFRVSQTTDIESSPFGLSIGQQQQSHLSASYHAAIPGMGKLDLGQGMQSQTYDFFQIDDSASSDAQVAFRKGELIKATLSHSASQSTHKKEFVQGQLVQNMELPHTSQSLSKDMLKLLDQMPLGTQSATGTLAGPAASILQQVNSFVGLQVNPSDVEFAGERN